MDGWSDWDFPDDPEEMAQQMRAVLEDPYYDHEAKTEVLTLLTNMADGAAREVLRWYRDHAERGMALTAQLALIEADRLLDQPDREPWHDDLIHRIRVLGEEMNPDGGRFPPHATFRAALAETLRREGWALIEGGQALLWFERELIAFAGLDLVVGGSTLVGFWDREAEEREWVALEESDSDHRFDPLEPFYVAMRAANLPWGIFIDISGDTLYADLIHNRDAEFGGAPPFQHLARLPGAHTPPGLAMN